jgi:hypothetical protein
MMAEVGAKVGNSGGKDKKTMVVRGWGKAWGKVV